MILKYLKFLKAPVGKIVSINRIETFSVEEYFDFVRIYEGSTGNLLTQLTGNLGSINSIVSTGNTIQIKFTR